MVLTVDIGNSNIVIGAWDNDALQFTGRIQTRRDYTEDELMTSFEELLGDIQSNMTSDTDEKSDDHKFACAFEGAILSSVVPEITDVTLNTLEKITGKRPLLMGPFLHTGVDISDYAPGAVGTDRIVDLSAALAMYGAPVMVCDLGTCTTISVAGTADDERMRSDNGNCASDQRYLGKLIGGMICPGVQLSLDAEAKRASQLPQLTAGKVDSLLGKDTASNMMSGAVAATGLMLSELADRLAQGESDYVQNDNVYSGSLSDSASCNNALKPCAGLKVVITGGLAQYVMPWIKCSAEVHYEQDLLLRGLYEVYCSNNCI